MIPSFSMRRSSRCRDGRETFISIAHLEIEPGMGMERFPLWRICMRSQKAAFWAIPLYKEYCETHPDQKIVLMGDSAGGGLVAALAEQFKEDGIRMPDELILLSPWVDMSMENEQIKEYEPRDPFLPMSQLVMCANYWKGDLDLHDRRLSPIYGDVKGIRNVTAFVGTCELFYPDVTKFFGMLDEDPSNELIVGEEMNHVYPLLPIKEAEPAVEKIIQKVKR